MSENNMKFIGAGEQQTTTQFHPAASAYIQVAQAEDEYTKNDRRREALRCSVDCAAPGEPSDVTISRAIQFEAYLKGHPTQQGATGPVAETTWTFVPNSDISVPVTDHVVYSTGAQEIDIAA